MLSNFLYDLSMFLTSLQDKTNPVINNINNFIIKEIYYKKLFNIVWRKKLHSPIKQIKFNYTYNIIDQNFKFIKLKFNLKKLLILKNLNNDIESYCIDKYLIIMEYINDNFKIHMLINEEENPCLYNYALNCDLNQIETLLSFSSKNLWIDNFTNIDSLYENFISYVSNSKFSENKNRTSNFNVLAACNYAEKFALTPNPNYKTFDGVGGDCTNFVSQIIYEGGINFTNTWKPYTNAWIRVHDFFVYLTSLNIGISPIDNYNLSKGDIIQFYSPKAGRFSHTGFITYELYNDCLYCCHSYNKLNYPLSSIYPIIYPKFRTIKIK